MFQPTYINIFLPVILNCEYFFYGLTKISVKEFKPNVFLLISAVIGGAVVGLLCAILCVMFVVYRMRKKDEGSYALDEPKRSPTVNSYSKPPSREFYA